MATRKPTMLQSAISHLKEEIALKRDFTSLGETAFLSLVWTWQRLEAMGRTFFPAMGITDAQFNVMMILWDYRGQVLRQHELAEILVVNRASMGGVLDRMERNGWIKRNTDPNDRRAQFVTLSDAGIAKLNEVKGPYYKLLNQLFAGTEDAELNKLILFFDKLRFRLAQIEAMQNAKPVRKARRDE